MNSDDITTSHRLAKLNRRSMCERRRAQRRSTFSISRIVPNFISEHILHFGEARSTLFKIVEKHSLELNSKEITQGEKQRERKKKKNLRGMAEKKKIGFLCDTSGIFRALVVSWHDGCS